ncbi:F-box protein At5g06550-like isoform X2 [Salvia splendens]|uniref:F-box protein At5g06550-like isoform X2 n=1 Tax=Salvia splendens TaxID=180675 RepID=UPI001C253A0A|nr:F-box protein At5g06550-like isoform X2 [Salvia splendens]
MLSSKNLWVKARSKKSKKSRVTHSKRPNSAAKKQKLEFKRQATGVAPPPHSLTEEEEFEQTEEGKFSLKNSAQSHSHGVQPLGNLYFSSSPTNSRNTGLGNLQILTDELLLEILAFLSGTQLGVLSTVSKSFYVFCNQEPLWRNLVLDTYQNGFLYKGTWKNTFVSSYKSSFKIVSSGVRVRDFYSDYLFQSWLCANLEMKPEWIERDNIVRRRGISVDEFILSFEEPNKPVLLEGCLEKWPAMEKWDREYLVEVCGDEQFLVGPVQMKLGDYFRYSDQVKEERPLYLFDPKFAEKVPQLGMDYGVPEYFSEDLFSVLGSERPDYRWIIIGPAGSGSSFHIDPNSTSAWNAVVRGSKKWVLFPPDVVPPGVHPSPDGAEVACPVSIIEWFMNFYSATKSWEKRTIECVCKAGEVIFVPNGWWHLVINLEDSVAITQNFASGRNLLNVLDFLKRPNASSLVSGTRDRVNLHDKFRNAIDAALPGTIDDLKVKAEEKEKQAKKVSFWETVTDSKSSSSSSSNDDGSSLSSI